MGATRPAGRQPGVGGSVRHRVRGRAHRDDRGHGDRRWRALLLRPVPAAGPPRGPSVPRRLLLPEHSRGRGLHIVGGRGERRLHPRPRLHFPTGTAAIVAPFQNITLGSLHASTLAEVPWRHVVPSEGEYFIEFNHQPHADTYIEALEELIVEVGTGAQAFVLSLGYDIVESDPHGSWDFSQLIFMEIGEVLAYAGLPVCVVQEGGYALDALADCSEAFAAGLLMEEDD